MRHIVRYQIVAAVIMIMMTASMWMATGHAQLPSPGPSSGSVGLEGTVPTAPPSRGATITIPAEGAVFTDIPVTVSGLCQTGLLVKLFSNNVFVGSVVCASGSYSLQISLFSGKNDLVARVYDALDQAGPDSNTVSVTFNDAQFDEFGTHVSLSSDYARRGAPPGTELDWPILLSDGSGPYALSIDWGDGSPTDLISVENSGALTIRHTYKTAGTYRVIIKATDKNGGVAFLQLVAQATGAVQSNNSKNNSPNVKVVTKIEYWPALAMLPLIFAAFWLGSRYERRRIKTRF